MAYVLEPVLGSLVGANSSADLLCVYGLRVRCLGSLEPGRLTVGAGAGLRSPFTDGCWRYESLPLGGE
jgi:hypothetical protein